MNKIVNYQSFNNKWYKPGNKVIIFIWYFVNIFIFKNPLNPFSGLKVFILKLFGAKIGNNVLLKPSINIKYPWKLTLGDYSMIGENVWIDNLDDVIIGSNVCISQGAILLSGNHNYKKTSFDLILGKIILEDGVWICAKSIVCANVICKTHSILSVNSTATKNLEPYTIYSGTPAAKLRDRIIL
jgi:putative colanic acid biosynthesis acetyltransferase WcaF